MKTKVIVLISLLSLLMACLEKENKVEKLVEKTEFLHDVETMPRMSELVGYQKQLRNLQMNAVVDGDTLPDFHTIDSLFVALEEAEDAMMRWMPAYHDAKESLEQKSPEEQLEIMEGELNGIEIVKELMDGSMENAANFIKAKKN